MKTAVQAEGYCLYVLIHLKDGIEFVYTFLKLIPHSDGQTSCVKFRTPNCPTQPGWTKNGEAALLFMKAAINQ